MTLAKFKRPMGMIALTALFFKAETAFAPED